MGNGDDFDPGPAQGDPMTTMILASTRCAARREGWRRASVIVARRRRSVATTASGPRTREGVKALSRLAMTSYWRLGQSQRDGGGFFDAQTRAEGLDFAVPLGFEPLIGDGASLRAKTMESFAAGGGLRTRAWFDGEGERRTTRAGVFATTFSESEWVIVVFRGTTPSPLRGLIRESQINGRAGQAEFIGGAGRVHAGYAEAYEMLRKDIEDAVRREMDEAPSSSGKSKRLVVTGHSLGGALSTICAGRLAAEYGKEGVTVDAVTFGQPRVGDKEFVRHLDEDLPNLNYARVVHGGDLFARVPTSGYWLPTSNEGRFAVEYAHAGSMLWTDANDENGSSATTHLYRAKGEQDPAKFMRDARMLNPVTVANHHSGYARFFDEDETIYDAWPESGLL